MGREAVTTKNTVLDKVKECIAVANFATSRVAVVETQHNKLIARLEAEQQANAADHLAFSDHIVEFHIGLTALKRAQSHQDALSAEFRAARWYVRVWALLRWIWTGEVTRQEEP